MKLYKYRNQIERDIDNLVENKLFAPDKENLNDPTEMYLDDSEFLDFIEKHKEHSQPLKEIFDDLINFTKTKCGVFSLSEDVNNELLWAYYADGHKGFCIEYDSDIIMESYNYGLEMKNLKLVSSPLVHRIKVVYKNSYPVLNREDLVRKDDLNPILTCIVGTKSKRWDQENEVRLIFNKYGNTELDYRAVTGIYFGEKFGDEEEKDKVMKKLQGRGIRYYQMKFIDKSYVMSFYEIKDKYASAPRFIANDLSYDNVKWIGMPSENTEYKDLAIQALEIVKKEPCINKIQSCYISWPPNPMIAIENPMIAIETLVNDDFKTHPIKIYRFDIDTSTNKIRLRKFQPS